MFLPAQRVYSSNSVGVIDQIPGSFAFHDTSSHFCSDQPPTGHSDRSRPTLFPLVRLRTSRHAQRRNFSSIPRASQTPFRRDENTFIHRVQTYSRLAWLHL